MPGDLDEIVTPEASSGSVTARSARITSNLTGPRLTTGRTITGVTMGDGRLDELIPSLLELHRQGRFPVDRLVTTYPFADINQAFADAESGRIVKAVLVPG